MRLWKCYAATAVLIVPVMASADPCPAPPPPFTDIATTDSICTNVEWLKNRGITLGCAGTDYCPNDFVLRSQMALFMNRLGATLSPSVTLTQGAASSLEDLDTESFHCVSPVIAAASHPRRMALTAHFSGLAAGAASYNVYIVHNTDGDATMFPLNSGIFMRVGTTGASWTHASNSTAINLTAATTYRFAIGVIRESGAADLSAYTVRSPANVSQSKRDLEPLRRRARMSAVVQSLPISANPPRIDCSGIPIPRATS